MKLIVANERQVSTLPKSSLQLNLENPSFLKYSKPLLFVIEECLSGSILVYDTVDNKVLAKKQISWPCSISIYKDLVATANYISSSISIFKWKDNRLESVFEKRFEGSSVTKRQKCSHPHEVVFDGDIVYVPDLGMDEIHRFQLPVEFCNDEYHGNIQSNTDNIPSKLPQFKQLNPITIPPGYGPRHLIIINELIYLVSELVSHLVVIDKYTLEIIKDVQLLDKDREGAAEIQVFKDTVFVSIRNIKPRAKGHNLNGIASGSASTENDENGWIVSVNMKTFAKLTTPLKGRLPRFFKIHNDLLYCLFQDQDFCQVFKIVDGSLVQVDEISTPRGCSCLDFIEG